MGTPSLPVAEEVPLVAELVPPTPALPRANQSLHADNPYAAPQTTLLAMPPGVETSYYIQGRDVVSTNPLTLPPLCIFCGAHAHDAPKQQKTIGVNAWWHYLFILLGVLPGVIFLVTLQKSCVVDYYLCREHLRGRWRLYGWLWGIFLGSICCIFFVSIITVVPSSLVSVVIGILAITSIIALPVSLLIMMNQSHILLGKRHKAGWFWIRGTKQPFRDALVAGGISQVP
ncbi:MAG: hypothetical protein SFX18_18545 [Pirellulales bacterium]|nr:hypothetical protein [Pirellulales bacterium]